MNGYFPNKIILIHDRSYFLNKNYKKVYDNRLFRIDGLFRIDHLNDYGFSVSEIKEVLEHCVNIKKPKPLEIKIKKHIKNFLSEVHENVAHLDNIKLTERNEFEYPIDFTEHQIKNILQNFLNYVSKTIKHKLFNETEIVFVDDFNQVEYPKIFTDLRGHDIEDIIYKNIFGLDKVSSKKIIDHFTESNENNIYIPFDLEKKFDNLCMLYVELNKNNFEDKVLNSNKYWIVKFI